MLSSRILSLSDQNKDTQIKLETNSNEDKIRFFTEGDQRIIISNSSNSGNIGIGKNFNNPTYTLDIKGNLSISDKLDISKNLSVSGNGIFNDKINIGNLTLADGSITDSSGTISFGDENL